MNNTVHDSLQLICFNTGMWWRNRWNATIPPLQPPLFHNQQQSTSARGSTAAYRGTEGTVWSVWTACLVSVLVSVAVLSWRARLVRLVGVAQCFGLVRRLDTAIGLDFEIVCDPLRSAPPEKTAYCVAQREDWKGGMVLTLWSIF